MALPLSGSELLHLGHGTYMWIQVTHFVIDGRQDDAAVITELLDSAEYAIDYLSPIPTENALTGNRVHARWVLGAITLDRFEPSTAERAKAELDEWATEQDWTDSDYEQPPEVLDRLRAVHELLRTGTVHKLRNPGSEDEHEYGSVLGITGLLEFIVIDRARSALHVIVAADD